MKNQQKSILIGLLSCITVFFLAAAFLAGCGQKAQETQVTVKAPS